MSVSQPTIQTKSNGRLERGPAWHRSTTRKAILEAARVMIEREGLEKTSLLRIAERAGFAPPTVYAYFVRKSDLIAAIVADDLASFARKIREDFPFSEMPEEVPEPVLEESLPDLAPLHTTLSARALSRIESPAATLYSDAQMPGADPVIPVETPMPREAIAHPADVEPLVAEEAAHVVSAHPATSANDNVIAAFEARLAELEARRVDPWLERRLREFERMLESLEERMGKAAESHTTAPAEGRLQELFERLDALEKKHEAAHEEASKSLAQDAEARETRLRQAHGELRTLMLETSGRVEALERERATHALAEEMPAVDFAPHEENVPHAEESQASHAEIERAEAPAELDEAVGEAVVPDASYLAAARRAAMTAQSLAQADENGSGIDPAVWVGTISPRTRILLSVCVGLGVVLLGAGLLLNRHSSARTDAPARPVHSAKLLLPPAKTVQATDFSGVYTAALAGNGRAQLQIGLTYLQGHGVTEDDARAAHWLESAATQDNAVAQYWLATLFEHGKGEKANAAQALRWYEAAALQGNLKAMYKLAVCYAQGWGTPQNYGEGARWFSRAGELGFVNAQYNLGVLYERGFGVPQSLLDAYKWYAIAAAQGDKDSALRVDALSSQLNAEDLVTARAQVAAFKPQAVDPAANDVPALPSTKTHTAPASKS